MKVFFKTISCVVVMALFSLPMNVSASCITQGADGTITITCGSSDGCCFKQFTMRGHTSCHFTGSASDYCDPGGGIIPEE